MKLCDLSTGDAVYRYEKSIVVFFKGKRKVLSTSVFNGGYSEKFTAVFNHDATQSKGMPCKMYADTYDAHMRIVAEKIGLQADEVSGMGTAASMDNVAIVSESYKALTVTAIVTGGIETNGGRVGDPSDYYKPLIKDLKPGTINIILVLDSDMPPGTLARALVTCTEAKTAAIQELMAGSNYSTGLATGSGTDQTMIIANAESELYLESTGKHSKTGELIGKVVMRAVKEALYKETGLCPSSQHSALMRFKRFKVTEDTLWDRFKERNDRDIIKPVFLEILDSIEKDSFIVTNTSLYIHLLDQYLWGLLEEKEVVVCAQKILLLIGEKYGVKANNILTEASVDAFNTAWTEVLVEILHAKAAES